MSQSLDTETLRVRSQANLRGRRPASWVLQSAITPYPLLFYLENLQLGTVQNTKRSLTSSLYEPCQPLLVGLNVREKLALRIKLSIEINQPSSHIPFFFSSPYTPQIRFIYLNIFVLIFTLMII